MEVARAPTRFGLRPRPGAAGVVQSQRQVLLSSRVNLSPSKQVSNSGEPLPGLRSQPQSSTSIQSSKTLPNHRLQQHAQTSGKTVIRETLVDTNDYESEYEGSDNDNTKSLTKPSTSGDREADASFAHDDSLNASVQDLSLRSAVSLPQLDAGAENANESNFGGAGMDMDVSANNSEEQNHSLLHPTPSPNNSEISDQDSEKSVATVVNAHGISEESDDEDTDINLPQDGDTTVSFLKAPLLKHFRTVSAFDLQDLF